MATKPFKGVINVDVRDSVPDWEPYKQPEAPEGAPSVLYIVLDDTGFSAMEPWGGLIKTPNIKRIAAQGLCIGRDSGEPVAAEYADERPFRFTGGVIKQVIVDVSGEAYVNLEHEAQMALMRD